MRDGWVETKLGDICRVTSGFAFSTKSWREQGIPVIKINNVRNGRVSIDNCSFISEPIPEGASKFLLKKGDLLITLTGEIGAIGFVTLSQPMYLNQRVGRIDLLDSEKCLIKFIGLFLTLPEVRAEMWSHGKGNAQLNISPTSIHQLNIPLPPLDEQKRIVDLISSVDSYIEALQQQVDKARKSRNAVLHELLTKGGDGWVVQTLKDISEVVMGRQLSPSKKLGIRSRPYIRAANIGSWGINIDDIFEMDFTETEERKFACKIGDTILVEGGNEKSVGCPALISKREVGLCIQNTVIRCRSTDISIFDPSFQFHVLRFKFWRGDFAELCAGTTIMHLGQKRAELVKIDLPPLAEQKRIVEIISVFDNQIEALDSTITKTQNLRSALLSDLLSGNHEIPNTYDKLIGAA